MKSLLLGIFLGVLLLSACGQSGDLYLPDNPPPAEQKRAEKERERSESPQPSQQEAQ